MMRSWQLQEAKNKFSEVVDEAIKHGPQLITRRGVEVAVVLSRSDYSKLMRSQQKHSDFFRESPLVGADLDLSRGAGDDRILPIDTAVMLTWGGLTGGLERAGTKMSASLNPLMLQIGSLRNHHHTQRCRR